jgi:hypothetical protein
MRFVDATTGRTLVEAKSDAKGNYRLELPGITKQTTISIDAMKPGYRRLVGTMMAGGDARRVEVGPGTAAEANLTLKPARYLAGIVYNERGKPVSGVKLAANALSVRSEGAIERTTSNPDGSFELFCYPVDPNDFPNQASKGVITFSHPDYISLKFEDVYALERNQLETLRIFLETGQKVTGTVLDAAGKSVPNVMIKIIGEEATYRKATRTDANGKFALRGLSSGLAKLSAHAMGIKQKIQLPVVIDSDKNDLEVRLQPMSLPANLKKYTVLGMQLVDVTPELKSAYDLMFGEGALILDPGKNSDRLEIGSLAPRYSIWLVGNTRVGSVREFVDQILAETAGQRVEASTVRVVYSFSTLEYETNNTQFLKLTNDDIKQLQIVSDQLKAASR